MMCKCLFSIVSYIRTNVREKDVARRRSVSTGFILDDFPRDG